MSRIFIVDAYSILFRTYYSSTDMFTSNQIPIGGVFGFVRTIFTIIQKYSVQNLVITLDSGKKTFRSDLYSEYKANRVAVPQNLIPQFGMLQEFLENSNILHLKKEGFEADDIIASIVKSQERSDISVITSDKDLLQLVDDRVNCIDFFKNKTYLTQDVVDKFGLEPKQILDYLALLGDSSDNIPGVKGCGEKGAIKLIKEFGSLENIIANVESIGNNRLKDAIKNYADYGILSKKLAQLCCDVPLPELNFSIANINFEKTRQFLEKYEMKSLFYMLERLKNQSNKSIIGSSVQEVQIAQNKNLLANKTLKNTQGELF
jgi:DNA polymerase-1